MYERCIENFLKKYDPSHVERHSDSSDFENLNDVPLVNKKFGIHSLALDETRYDKPEKDYSVYHAYNKNEHFNNITKCDYSDRARCIKHRNTKANMRSNEPPGKHKLHQSDVVSQSNKKNSGDQSSLNLIKWCYSKSIIRNKVIPRLSTIFRRSNYSKTPMERIEEDVKTKRHDCDTTCCPYCKREKLSKKTRVRRDISPQSVYAVNQNLHSFPIPYSGHPAPLTKVYSIKNCSELSFDNNCTSSDSEIEIIKKPNHRKHKNITKDRSGKKVRKEYIIEKQSSRNKQQQFPSKTQLKTPCQVYNSASCQVEHDTMESSYYQNNFFTSTSSALWDILPDKIKLQGDKTENLTPCRCDPVQSKPAPCNAETCKYKKPVDKINMPKSCCKLLESLSNESITSIGQEIKKKKIKPLQVTCKCNEIKKKKESKLDVEIQKDEPRSCQEDHERLTALLAQKYKGEILCIHNPPCILINGCLNLPPPQTQVPATLWPVTQTKKSSFVQMCRKIKGVKDNKPDMEQSSQYHPPYTDIKQCLPEFATEKVIQSVCNHNPPCEVVRGCFKPKYDPRLQNSCIHVPSCNKVPECLLGATVCQNNTCIHKPRCAELPLCSRKYIVLTAREDVSTQVQPKTKICRHEPPCFLIPKCLAYAMCSDYVPVDAVPGCTHQPSCEMIPACCRKSAKEMVSVPSQYPHSACRIV